MTAPRTLAALRAAVARVLVARGESAVALVCDVYPLWRRDGWGATINALVCNTVVDWLAMGGNTRAEAIDTVWRRFVVELETEHESAKRACASTRRPERKAAASARYARARAALAAARRPEDEGGGGR